MSSESESDDNGLCNLPEEMGIGDDRGTEIVRQILMKRKSFEDENRAVSKMHEWLEEEFEGMDLNYAYFVFGRMLEYLIVQTYPHRSIGTYINAYEVFSMITED